MSVILLMIPISLLLSLGFLVAFIWSAKKGQFDHIDLEGHRILNEENRQVSQLNNSKIKNRKEKHGTTDETN